LIGKWHLGLESPNIPNERGFDDFHGFLDDMMDSYTTHLHGGINFIRHNSEVIEPKGHATDIFTDWACDYLRRQATAAKPFFLYLACNAPHFPIEPPADFLQKVKSRLPTLDEKRAQNVAFVEHLDDRIGKVLAALGEAGLEKIPWWFLPLIMAAHSLIPKAMIPGVGGNRTTTTAVCACLSSRDGRVESSQAH
jgi:arylsulfatase A-like enzyme